MYSSKLDFSWMPFYKEMAETLLSYREKRGELLEILYSSFNTLGISSSMYVNNAPDGEGTVPLTNIDPLTFMGTFNRGNKKSDRIKIANLIAEKLGMHNKLNDDEEFLSIPVLNSQHSTLTSRNCTEENYDKLWNLFSAALSFDINQPEDYVKAFDEALTVRGTGRRYATMSCYWINPYNIFSIDEQSITYLKHYGINIGRRTSGNEYIALLEQVNEAMENGVIKEQTYPQFSYNAWLFNGGKALDEKSEDNFEELDMNKNIPLNQILYGPPGTGKTYITKQMAVQICEPDFYASLDNPDDCRDQICEKYNELVDSKRIAFTTFHQSMSYEDFIEGIKPSLDGSSSLEYKIQNGIFKEISIRAKKNIEDSEKNVDVLKAERTIEEKVLAFLSNLKINEKNLYTATNKDFQITGINDESFEISSSASKNVITISLKDFFTVASSKDTFEKPLDVAKFLNHKNGGYQSDSYLFPIYKEYLQTEIQVEQVSDKKVDLQNYLLIIDEINRGNIPQIFGELITLIEESKREGAEDEQSCILPYSQKPFSVPQNLYILGTMNTADRSVEALDTALRRRFNFIPMMPDSNQLDTNVDGVDLKKLLETLNKRIEYLLDRDHTIGHAYLINCVSRNDIVKVFKNKIIPQLQEYFYSDWKKIQLVLGESIVKEREQNSVKDIFGIDMLDDYSDDKKAYYISENTEEWDFNLPVKLSTN